MTTAEKLTQIAENQQAVYNAGFAAGKAQGGGEGSYDEGYAAAQQAEYDKLWDAIQREGKRAHYSYAFSYSGWNDTVYNPKYPITPTNTSGICYMMTWNHEITDTKVPITVFGNCIHAFGNAANLKRIPKLIFDGATNLKDMFLNCAKLKELYCEGEIALSLSLAQSNLLNADSVQSVIDCLKDLTGQTAQKITWHTDVLLNLTDEQLLAITAKNWTM